MKRLCIWALAMALAACGGSNSTNLDGAAYGAATPDVAGLALETTGTAADGLAAATAAAPLDSVAVSAAALAAAQAPEYLVKTRQAIKDLNAFVRAVVEPVEALAKTTPVSNVDGVAVFQGDYPATGTPVASFQLTVKQDGDADHFKFKLEGKKPADSTYVVVLAGRVKRGDRPHRGRGVLGIDLDKLFSLNPASGPIWKAKGQLLVAFAHVGNAKALAYALKAFTPDSTNQSIYPVTAFLVGHKTDSIPVVARVRIVALGELYAGTPDLGPELLLSRLLSVPGQGGRAAVVVANPPAATGLQGDLPQGKFFVGLSCWDKSEIEVYKQGFICSVAPGPGGCVDAQLSDAVGTMAACLPATDLDAPGQQGTDHMSGAMEPGAPATPDAPPSSMDDVLFN
jgi:hypothetical protein